MEERTHQDVLRMTWVRFRSVLNCIPEIDRIKEKRPMTHAERIAQMKHEKGDL